MENNKIYSSINYNKNNRPTSFKSYRNSSLSLTKSHSTNEIFSNNKECYQINKNKIYKKLPINYSNENNNNKYNNSILNEESIINENEERFHKEVVPSLFSDLAISPIDLIQSPTIENKNCINYTNIRNNILKDLNRNDYNIIENNFSNQIFNFPYELLIEYENKKRLEELRNKYLSSSSLVFLKKGEEANKSRDNI